MPELSSKAKDQLAGLESATFKKSNTVISKLPPVALGGEMADKLKESEKTIAKLELKVKSLEESLLQEKKAHNSGGGGNNDLLEAEIASLRKENSSLMVRQL